MGANSKTKRLHKYMLQRLIVTEGNMEQWASADRWLGEEMLLRLDQVVALKEGDTERACGIHDKRIECLEKAVEALRRCPACGPVEHQDGGGTQ